MQERIQLISYRDVELEKTIDHCRMLKKIKKISCIILLFIF